MNNTKSLKLGVVTLTAGLTLMAAPHFAYAAPAGAAFQLGERGTTRGENYDTKIVVKSGDNAVVGATVTFRRGTHVITKVTGDDGVATFSTKGGTYKVSAMKGAAKATINVTVTPTTTTKIVEMVLPSS